MKATHYLSRELPAGLELLLELTTDLRWSWSHAADALWQTMDPDIWSQTRNPYVVLQNLSEERLQQLAQDPHFKQRLETTAQAREDYRRRPAWFGENYAQAGLRGVAYFSMEFGLGNALPLYAGGLGILAGDYLKAASDLGVPLVGIGLLYQEGYFRQSLDRAGWQQEVYPYNDPTMLPVVPVFSSAGNWLHVDANLPGRRVRFRIWQARVGRVTLYLLDSNDPLNSPADRGITNKLYGGSHEMRLLQEIALGVGGWRVVEALGLDIDICHLNEGHAAFAAIERARCYMDRHGVDFHQALWTTRAGNIFTTHTPVSAGFDRFPAELIFKYGQEYMAGLGLDFDALLALGRLDANDRREPFNMAYLAMRTCMKVNGVSQLHGEVSRELFNPLYPRWPRHDVPVDYVTNGVHVPSWDSLWADDLWTQAVDKQRWLAEPEPLSGAIERLTDERLWNFKGHERADLVTYARERHRRQLGYSGASAAELERAGDVLDPNILTLGFARRFAEYKRPNLLLHDEARLTRLLTNNDTPLQIIVAGKAHPQDDAGKCFIQHWARFAQRLEVRHRVVFLEDYDMALAQELVQGVDVWINTPRRPWEACGTSGMKVLANGGLNLSVLDGWWAEAYGDDVGWAVGDRENHNDSRHDGLEAEQLYRLLEEVVVPEFYRRDANGIPRAWTARMRASMARLAPQFSTNRMMREYVMRMYLPASEAYRLRSADEGRLGRSLCRWAERLRHHWQGIHFGNLVSERHDKRQRFEVQVYLGDILAEAVQVQLYAEQEGVSEASCALMQQGEPIPGSANGYVYRVEIDTEQAAADFTPRVVPHNDGARIPLELPLIKWFR
ncbi:alpha-glucan phosphorylase [Candidatus Tenderia electrophaga]|jgi:starch phosphorylase|uniref:Alpha-glucan phosphorylase n=1 Tax=Candidatus Tenderia electrophaga TaxID=1748243 RepID=A0A0S2TDB6_9GAMM|nr:alpha-glucan phosphorylase [Candidatus Tenderia electrophaga]